MKLCITLLFSIFLSAPGISQEIIEACKSGQPLREALRINYTPSQTLGYGPARDTLYARIDSDNFELSGIYTDFSVLLDPAEDPTVSAFQNGDGLNAEHVYPQSLGAGQEPARSDMHNIFPAKVNVNESRGNCPYGEIEDTDTDQWYWLDIQTNNIPATNIDNYSEKDEEDCFFEPRENVKGDVARAIFYFHTIYEDITESIDPNYLDQQKTVLLQWHKQDPVTEEERVRDSLIALRQGNHNPYIIDSSLVRRAYFLPDAVYPEGSEDCYDIITNTRTTEKVQWIKLSNSIVKESIFFEVTSDTHIIIFGLNTVPVLQRFYAPGSYSLVLDQLIKGTYILSTYNESQSIAFRFIKI